MNDPSPWLTTGIEDLGALGSAAAAVVAVLLAKRARADANDARRELKREQDQHLRRQASRVVVEAHARRHSVGVHYPARNIVVHVHNGSDEPIRDITVISWPTTQPEPLSRIDVASVIAPGQKATASGPDHPDFEGSLEHVHFRARYTAVNGDTWETDDTGRVARVSPNDLFDTK